MAMGLSGKNRHYKCSDITLDHWIQTGGRCGLTKALVLNMIDEIVELIPSILNTISRRLPQDFPDSVAEPIMNGLQTAANTISKNL